ncbi:MAG: trypsin-like peptidase domain-containing protein [Clostridiales bacterium]|jgi:serine protease Do|nr:trypsin-like peptidase domain-containing protein [Clostridiales bacterium]
MDYENNGLYGNGNESGNGVYENESKKDEWGMEMKVEEMKMEEMKVPEIKMDEMKMPESRVRFDSIFNLGGTEIPPQKSELDLSTDGFEMSREAPILETGGFMMQDTPPIGVPGVPAVAPAAPATSAVVSDAPAQNNAGASRPSKKSHSSFAKKTAAACLIAALGCGTLGIGLGVGGALASHFFTASKEDPTDQTQEVFSFSPNATREITEVSIAPSSVSGIVKKVSDAVVSISISTTQEQSFFHQMEQQGSGSGIIFSEDGDKVYIATNNHVIESANKVTISVDDQNHISAKFVGSDSQSDLAVISVSKADMTEAGISYKIADFGDSGQLQVGDEVVAIGNAMGEGKTATSGIISAINKQITIDGKTLAVIQTDAAINPGNSGGALANANGQIIGINTAKLGASGVEGMGYSIPSNEAKKIIEDLMANGSVRKPYLGIVGMTITSQMKDMYNLPSMGVYVAEVAAGSGAEVAGMQQNDIIVGFNDIKISSLDELSAAISKGTVGETVKIYIYRRANPIVLEAIIGDVNVDAKF